jgi:hypothetical protein
MERVTETHLVNLDTDESYLNYCKLTSHEADNSTDSQKDQRRIMTT